MSIFRSQLSRAINRHICSAENEENKSYICVRQLDSAILELMDKLPWYFQLGGDGQLPRVHEPLGEVITWQHHILRTFIGTQRIRIHHPFILSQPGCWETCANAAENTLAVYRAQRQGKAVTSQQKFFPQAYQMFSVAISLTTLLMVEGSFPTPNIYQEIKDIAGDLKGLEDQGCAVPIAAIGRQVLLKLCQLCEKETTPSTDSPEMTNPITSGASQVLSGHHAAGLHAQRQTYHRDEVLLDVAPSAEVPIPYNGFGMTPDSDGVILTDTDFTTRSLLDIAWGAMPSEFDWSLFLEDLNSSDILRHCPLSRYSAID